MTAESLRPDWVTQEIHDAAETAFPGVDLWPLNTVKGPVIVRTPTVADIDAHEKAPAGHQREANDALALACVAYPDAPTLRGYLIKHPLMGERLTEKLRSVAHGLTGDGDKPLSEAPGAWLPEGLPSKLIAGSPGVDLYAIRLAPGTIVLKTPATNVIDRTACNAGGNLPARDVFNCYVRDCTVYPTEDVIFGWFAKYPLMVVYLTNKLREYATGVIEETAKKL